AFLAAAFARRRPEDGWRAAALRAGVVWGVLLATITEALSQFGALAPGWLAVAWGAAALVAGITSRPVPSVPLVALRWPGGVECVCAAVVAAVVLVTGLLAVVAPPSTWDAMTYHLARVAHWALSGSVAFYPTPNLRQLHMPPLAEFAALHLELLG